jgi:glycerol-3-phosphate acyltransferase PlsX
MFGRFGAGTGGREGRESIRTQQRRGSMAGTITASLDVMGGDKGAEVVLPGADLALRRHDGMRFRLFGDETIVRPLLDQYPRLKAVSDFEHCDVTVRMEDKPSQALRRGRGKSSMWRAIEAVKEGAGFAVSAGNTGALMAMALFCLRGQNDIDRPAIAGIWPTLRGEAVVLDIGATIGADAEQLFEYAVMGAAMARALFDKERPSVGLLNIGVEEIKGIEEIRLAGQMLKDADLPYLDYLGFVEGDDIGKGTTDVVVTEGFAGNIALKAAEGTARQIMSYLRQAMGASLAARIGYLLARGAFNRLRHRMDPRRSNGGVFLGLGGLVIKSHGGTDAEGFASAIEIGYSMARSGIVGKINSDLSAHRLAVAAGDKVANTGAL